MRDGLMENIPMSPVSVVFLSMPWKAFGIAITGDRFSSECLAGPLPLCLISCSLAARGRGVKLGLTLAFLCRFPAPLDGRAVSILYVPNCKNGRVYLDIGTRDLEMICLVLVVEVVVVLLAMEENSGDVWEVTVA